MSVGGRHGAPATRRARALGSLAILALLGGVFGTPARAQPDADPLTRARTLVREGELAEAVSVYSAILVRAPEDLQARKERARILGWLERYAEALADYDRVLAITPRDVDARTGRGRVLSWMHRYTEAEAEFRRALTDDPGSADTLVALGTVLAWQGRDDQAVAAFDQARARAPHDPAPLIALARLRYWREDLGAARALFEEALQLDPSHAEAHAGLARVAAAEAAAIPRRIRLDLGARYEVLTRGFSDWSQETARVTVQPARRTRLFAGVDQYRRFDRDDTQLTVGGVQNLPGDVTLSGAFTLGIDAEVVARQVYEVEAGYRLAPEATALLAYRHSDYPDGVRSDILSPGVDVWWWPYASVLGRYYFSHSSVAGDAHAGSVRVTLYPEARLSGYVGLAYGQETFLAGTVVEVVAAQDVLTVSTGVIWRIGDWGGLRLDYAFENRRDSYAKHGIGASLFVAF